MPDDNRVFMPAPVTLSIVMPAYNEEKTIATVVERVVKEVSCDF